jgi:oxaloacetate decarboxylase gamma subunit
MEIHLVGESLKFMVLGMIVVFLFLAILVELMKLQAKLIAKYFPEKEPEVPAARPGASATDDSARTAAIIAAITEFKKNKS